LTHSHLQAYAGAVFGYDQTSDPASPGDTRHLGSHMVESHLVFFIHTQGHLAMDLLRGMESNESRCPTGSGSGTGSFIVPAASMVLAIHVHTQSSDLLLHSKIEALFLVSGHHLPILLLLQTLEHYLGGFCIVTVSRLRAQP
jgi:hypothetical protein